MAAFMSTMPPMVAVRQFRTNETRIGLVECQNQRLVIGCDDGLLDVLRSESELGQNEGRCFVEKNGPAQRKLGVFCRYGIAGREDMAIGHGERDGLAVFRDFPARSKLRLIARVEVQRIEIDEFLVDVAADIRSGEFKALSRVEGLDVRRSGWQPPAYWEVSGRWPE